MSIATITEAQRVEVRDECSRAALYMQRWAQNAKVPDATDVTESNTALNAAAAALAVAGAAPGGTFATVANGGAVTITDSNGTPAVAGTASISAGVLNNVAITSATTAIVQNADVIPVKNSAGTTTASVTAAVVAGGVIASINMASQYAGVSNTGKQSVGTVSGSGTFGTFTVVNGVITGIVLSAS